MWVYEAAADTSAADVSALDLMTLVVAIIGAITGIVALVLQGIFFRNSGPGVTCMLAWARVQSTGRVV